ncbi:hypothetical protein B0H34DRAFT_677181 [Crassisporium funariophilum]|nr:hypothetical protein B0H34DRAFT_677181 [Crassisporium funariophilum]
MPSGRSDAQKSHMQHLANLQRARQNSAPPSVPSPVPRTRHQTASKKTVSEIRQKNAAIEDLESNLRDYRAQIAALVIILEQKDLNILDLQVRLANSENAARALDKALRNSDSLLTDASQDLQKSRKRSQRLVHERKLVNNKHLSDIKILAASYNKELKELHEALEALSLANGMTKKLETALVLEKDTNDGLQKKAHRLDMQRSCAQASLREFRTALNSKNTWSAKKGGKYTAQARRLARELLKAGCSSERVGDAMLACAKAFGVRVGDKMSGRTVLHARDEGGHFGLIQLGREIKQGLGFGESSDGTAHRKVTYEVHHVTMSVPSYQPGINDSDKSTWTYHTRFVEVEPALDHTAKTQFNGTKDLASRIATAYLESPLSDRDGVKMETDDWIRKEEFAHADHAADGKKKVRLCGEWKEEVACQDLGEKAMDSMDPDEILRAMLSIPQEEVDAVRSAGHE